MIKRLIIYIAFVLFAGAGGATQLVAWQFRYADVLGPGVLSLGPVKIYLPWKVLVWHGKYGHRYPEVFEKALVAPCLSAVLAAMGLMATRRHRLHVQAVGAQRWGNAHDLKRAGLLSDRGVVAGQWGKKILTYDGPEHQLVTGASRSGKGVGHVIPTLLNWPGSVVVYDPKCELFDITAGFRSTFSHTVYFNPTNPHSLRYNPLSEVRRGASEVRDVQNIANLLIDPGGYKQQMDVWDQNASQFLVGLMLHVLYSEPDDRKNLGRVRDLLLDFDNTCKKMMGTPHRLNPNTGHPEVHPEVAQVAKSLQNQGQRFRSSVRGTAESYLTLFADDLIRDSTATNNMAVGDLMCSDRPVSLYIQPPLSDLDRLRPLVRILLSQLARGLMEHRDRDNRGRTKQHRLLYLIDEFATLGRLDFFSTNLREMAGYGLKALLVVQSFSDIVEQYGVYNTIVDNCHIITAFASADTVTQTRISQMTGTVTEYREGYSRPQTWLPGLSRRQTVNYSEQVRPLLQPGDVRELPSDEQLLFVTGHKPFRTKKLRYYEQPMLQRRLLPPPDQSKHLDIPGNFINPWHGEKAKGPVMEVDDPPACEDEQEVIDNPDDALVDHTLDLEEPEDRFGL